MKTVTSIIITKAVVIVIKIKVVAGPMEVDELTQQEVMDQDQRKEERSYLQGTNTGPIREREKETLEKSEKCIVIEFKH